MRKQYETVIGLEVHVELATKTKIFCACSTAFGGAPNTHTCPVCTGMPGSLPVLNKKVVEYAIAVGLATNCTINQYCKFDRKNYFYPDNPQNYQISQLYLPICINGGAVSYTHLNLVRRKHSGNLSCTAGTGVSDRDHRLVMRGRQYCVKTKKRREPEERILAFCGCCMNQNSMCNVLRHRERCV